MLSRESFAHRRLPLSAAAAIAYGRLVKEESRATLLHVDGMLHVVATALAACIPVFEGGRALSGEELDGRPLVGLEVRKADLDLAIERLARAGVSFSHALPA
jgi:hypothetical protein